MWREYPHFDFRNAFRLFRTAYQTVILLRNTFYQVPGGCCIAPLYKKWFSSFFWATSGKISILTISFEITVCCVTFTVPFLVGLIKHQGWLVSIWLFAFLAREGFFIVFSAVSEGAGTIIQSGSDTLLFK